MDAYDLGARIRAARLRRGLEQVDLARALETTAPTISRYERGMHEPRPSDLVRLARVLAVPASYLLGETELVTASSAEDRIAQMLALAEPQAVGARIRQARVRSDKSQADVAMACGVSASLVSKWEAGARLPNGAMAISLARALGASIEALWQGTAPAVAQPEVIAEAVSLLQMTLASMGDIEPINKSGLARILSMLSQGGGVGMDDPIEFWRGELRPAVRGHVPCAGGQASVAERKLAMWRRLRSRADLALIPTVCEWLLAMSRVIDRRLAAMARWRRHK